jgi:hypothetical protein
MVLCKHDYKIILRRHVIMNMNVSFHNPQRQQVGFGMSLIILSDEARRLVPRRQLRRLRGMAARDTSDFSLSIERLGREGGYAEMKGLDPRYPNQVTAITTASYNPFNVNDKPSIQLGKLYQYALGLYQRNKKWLDSK